MNKRLVFGFLRFGHQAARPEPLPDRLVEVGFPAHVADVFARLRKGDKSSSTGALAQLFARSQLAFYYDECIWIADRERKTLSRCRQSGEAFDTWPLPVGAKAKPVATLGSARLVWDDGSLLQWDGEEPRWNKFPPPPARSKRHDWVRFWSRELKGYGEEEDQAVLSTHSAGRSQLRAHFKGSSPIASQLGSVRRAALGMDFSGAKLRIAYWKDSEPDDGKKGELPFATFSGTPLNLRWRDNAGDWPTGELYWNERKVTLAKVRMERPAFLTERETSSQLLDPWVLPSALHFPSWEPLDLTHGADWNGAYWLFSPEQPLLRQQVFEGPGAAWRALRPPAQRSLTGLIAEDLPQGAQAVDCGSFFLDPVDLHWVEYVPSQGYPQVSVSFWRQGKRLMAFPKTISRYSGSRGTIQEVTEQEHGAPTLEGRNLVRALQQGSARQVEGGWEIVVCEVWMGGTPSRDTVRLEINTDVRYILTTDTDASSG